MLTTHGFRRKLLFTIVVLLLVSAGFIAGRLSAPTPVYQMGGLFGDASMEQAWEDFVFAQRHTLERFRASPFFQDDQERAEAYLGVLYAVQDAIAVHALPLAEARARGEAPPLSPQPMAMALQAATGALLNITTSWQAQARELWRGAPRNSIGAARATAVAGQFTASGSWELNNDQAVLLELLPNAGGEREIVLTSLWYMGTELEPPGSRLRSGQLQCGAAQRCYVVISHRDPGVVNWLDTQGRRRGLIQLHWQGLHQETTALPQAHARLVAFDKLPGLLGVGTKQVAGEDS